MHSIKTDEDQRYCRCGAICAAGKSRCLKCRFRSSWYRRKAWRCNQPCTLSRNSQKETN